jgi:hypothetical protein
MVTFIAIVVRIPDLTQLIISLKMWQGRPTLQRHWDIKIIFLLKIKNRLYYFIQSTASFILQRNIKTEYQSYYSAFCYILILSHDIVWLQTGFGLVIGFIGHLLIVTVSNYSALTNSNILQFTTARAKSSQSAVSSPVVAWQRFPTADVPLTQLPAFNTSISQRLTCSSLTNSLTHQPTLHFPALHCTS